MREEEGEERRRRSVARDGEASASASPTETEVLALRRDLHDTRHRVRQLSAQVRAYAHAHAHPDLPPHHALNPSIAAFLSEPVRGDVDEEKLEEEMERRLRELRHHGTTTTSSTFTTLSSIKPSPTPTSSDTYLGFPFPLWRSLWRRGRRDGWLIHPTEVTVGAECGRGTTGTVSNGTFRSLPVVVKAMWLSEPNEVACFFRQVAIMTRTRHPCSVSLLGVLPWEAEKPHISSLKTWTNSNKTTITTTTTTTTTTTDTDTDTNATTFSSMPAFTADEDIAEMDRSCEIWLRGHTHGPRPFVPVALVMEQVGGGTLQTWLHPTVTRSIAIAPTSSYIFHPSPYPRNLQPTVDHFRTHLRARLTAMVDVGRALSYYHACTPSIVHRDLKSSNVLLTIHGEARLSDLGLARYVSPSPDAPPMTGETGTYLYMAPEVFRHDVYGTAADVFSFGVLLAEVVSLRVPYSHLLLTPTQVAFGVLRGTLRPTVVLPRGEIETEMEEMGMETHGKVEESWDAMELETVDRTATTNTNNNTTNNNNNAETREKRVPPLPSPSSPTITGSTMSTGARRGWAPTAVQEVETLVQACTATEPTDRPRMDEVVTRLIAILAIPAARGCGTSSAGVERKLFSGWGRWLGWS
jgi:serine/threonine protein kinase